MRISTAYQFQNYTDQVRIAQERYLEAQNAVMTGRRINKLSDDPFGSGTALNLRSFKAAVDQYTGNLQVGKGILTFSEAALGDTNDVMTQAYQIAVQSSTATTDQAARDSLAVQVETLQQHLLQLANSQGPSKQYVFAGQKNDSPPFTVSATAGANSVRLASGMYLNFNGDNLNVPVETGPGETMTVNTKGEDLFKKAYVALDQLKVDLQGGNISSLTGVDIKNIQDSMQRLTTERGSVGAKLQTVAMLTNHYGRRTDDLTAGISDIEEVDMAAAIQKYQLAQTTYNAALSVASQGYKLSLLDFIGA